MRKPKRELPSKISLYYAREYGVVLVDFIVPRGHKIPVSLNPERILAEKVTPESVGKDVLVRMKRVEKQISVEEDGSSYWYVSGIKSFRRFARTFSNVKVYLDDAGIHIEQLKLVAKYGGYALDKSKQPVDLPADVKPEVLGETLLTLLRSLEPKPLSDQETIETLNGNHLTFKVPGDDFKNCGDGGTDAYRVYRHVASEDTTLAFMIDSGYATYNATSIKEKWEQWYGPLKDFSYELEDRRTVVQATTTETEILSYLFHRGEETVELMTTIDKTVFRGRGLSKVRREYDAVAKSLRFEPAS